MNKNFRNILKSKVATIVTALGIIFSPLSADATLTPNADKTFCQCEQIENVVEINNNNDIIFESVTTNLPTLETTTPKAGQYNFDASEAINSAFGDFCARAARRGESVNALKPIADKMADLLSDVRVESVVVTRSVEEEYLNIRLYMPGDVLISLNVEEDDPEAVVNLYHKNTIMASDEADLNAIHKMLISVQHSNV